MEISYAKFNESRSGGGSGFGNNNFSKGPQPLREAGGGYRNSDSRSNHSSRHGGGDRSNNFLFDKY